MKASTHWISPPQNLLLADDEVHVWRAFLDISKNLIHKFMELLSEDEIIQANRFYFFLTMGTQKLISGHFSASLNLLT